MLSRFSWAWASLGGRLGRIPARWPGFWLFAGLALYAFCLGGGSGPGLSAGLRLGLAGVWAVLPIGLCVRPALVRFRPRAWALGLGVLGLMAWAEARAAADRPWSGLTWAQTERLQGWLERDPREGRFGPVVRVRLSAAGGGGHEAGAGGVLTLRLPLGTPMERSRGPGGEAPPGWGERVELTIEDPKSDPPRRAASLRLLGPGTGLSQGLAAAARFRAEVRCGALRGLAWFGPRTAALAGALLLGMTDDLSGAEADWFRAAGLSPLLALSGMHLGLWTWLWKRLTGQRLGLWASQIGLTLLLGGYLLLAGPFPSLVRAAAMALAATWLRAWGRGAPLAVVWAWTGALHLAWDPALAGDLSFQLSYLALGLLLGPVPWTDRALRPWLGVWLGPVLCSGLLIQAASAFSLGAHWPGLRWPALVLMPLVGTALSVLMVTAPLLAGLAGVFTALRVLPGLWVLEGLRRLVEAGIEGLYSLVYFASRFPPDPGWVWGFVALGGALLLLYNHERGHPGQLRLPRRPA